jgi:hypothetical protein
MFSNHSSLREFSPISTQNLGIKTQRTVNLFIFLVCVKLGLSHITAAQMEAF